MLPPNSPYNELNSFLDLKLKLTDWEQSLRVGITLHYITHSLQCTPTPAPGPIKHSQTSPSHPFLPKWWRSACSRNSSVGESGEIKLSHFLTVFDQSFWAMFSSLPLSMSSGWRKVGSSLLSLSLFAFLPHRRKAGGLTLLLLANFTCL